MKKNLVKVFHFYLLFLNILLAIPVILLLASSLGCGVMALASSKEILSFLFYIFVATPFFSAMLIGLVNLFIKLINKWF